MYRVQHIDPVTGNYRAAGGRDYASLGEAIVAAGEAWAGYVMARDRAFRDGIAHRVVIVNAWGNELGVVADPIDVWLGPEYGAKAT